VTRRVHAVVAGRVQGVGFRWFAVHAAREAGVGGFVRNLADGSVEVEAEGPPEAVEAFLGAIRRGPPAARVEGVRASEVPPRGDLAFDVRY
jgi:acylphosphatase